MTRHVLVTAAGRRVSLVRGFREAAEPHGIKVYASDLDPATSAACHVADGAHCLPAATDAEFIDALFDLCCRLSIGLVVPTIDPELPVLAAARERFEQHGIHIAVSDPEVVADCEDKRRTKRMFDGLRLGRPEIYAWPDVPGFPLFVKPYNGSASEGAMVVRDAVEAELALSASDRNIICEFIDPVDHDEFTVDCYFDRASTLICAVPRQRIEVRGGEVAKAQTVRNELVGELFARMPRLPGARGVLTVQAFVHRERRNTSYLEINARFSGGYPLARLAGANYQRLLIDEYLLDVSDVEAPEWRHGALMLRYDAEVVVFDV